MRKLKREWKDKEDAMADQIKSLKNMLGKAKLQF